MIFQRFYRSDQFRFGSSSMTPVVKFLLVFNVASFILRSFMTVFWGVPGLVFFDHFFGFSVHRVWNDLYLWQIITYMFLHGSFAHIFFNMFALWMFGPDIERKLGSREFIKYYFITGIGAIFFFFITHLNEINLSADVAAQGSVVLGASGAIFGVLGAYGYYFGNRMLLLIFPPIPIRARTLVMVTALLELFFLLTQPGSSIAHIAHLGGLFIGLAYLHFWKGGRRPPGIKDLFRWWKIRKLKKKLHIIRGSDVELGEDEYRWH